MAIDPVCKMDVNENLATTKTEYNGRNYYFCSSECEEKFQMEPEKYSTAAAA